MIILLLNGCSTADADNLKQISNDISKDNDRVEGEYLIKLKPDFGEGAIKKVMSDFNISKIENIGDRLYKIKLNNDPGPEKISRIAEKSDSIEYAEPNYIYRINPPRKQKQVKPAIGK